MLGFLFVSLSTNLSGGTPKQNTPIILSEAAYSLPAMDFTRLTAHISHHLFVLDKPSFRGPFRIHVCQSKIHLYQLFFPRFSRILCGPL